jgi:hypothetical protein
MDFKSCEMLTSFMNGKIDTRSCDVRISPELIRVDYSEDGRSLSYCGKNLGDGHFKLENVDKGQATLHWEPENKCFIGFWVEDGSEGFWKISVERKCRVKQ